MQYSEITQLIKQRRKELGLTLQQVADLTGDYKQRIAVIENGANTRAEHLIKICQALDLDIIILPKL